MSIKKKGMELEELLKLVYYYYPENISSTLDREEYANSKECKRLSLALNSGKINEFLEKDIDELKNEIENMFEAPIVDHTLPTWEDRCLNLQFLLKPEKDRSEKYILCINISKLIPFFIIYILEVDFDENLNRLKYFPRRNMVKEQSDFKTDIDLVREVVLSKLKKYNEFPTELLKVEIKNVNFQDIEMGNFTFFNAFFLNNFTTKFA